MKKILLLISVVIVGVSLTSCSLKTQYTSENTRIKYGVTTDIKNNKPITGVYKARQGNGLWVEANYKDGKRDGVYKEYDKNGKLSKEKNYEDGWLDGVFKVYHVNGNLGIEGNYEDGKRDGVHKYYDENGKLEREENYKDDKLQ